MRKHFDPIKRTTFWCQSDTLEEQARRGIRSIQRRIANPGMAEDCRALALHELKRWRRILATGGIVALLMHGCTPCPAGEIVKPDFERLATAIFYAEGGTNTRHAYGILAHYKTTTPRTACINTIRRSWGNYVATGQRGDFVAWLGATYAPVGCKNDPTGSNRFWVSNVRRLYDNHHT